jgi:hypothetical protein
MGLSRDLGGKSIGISKFLATSPFDARTAHLDFVELRAAL